MLIIAGDLCATNTEKEYDDLWRWILYQPYEYVMMIAGNHDNFLQENPDYFSSYGGNFCYLCDSGCEIEGFKIWGSPWTKTFDGMNPKCKAFTVDTESELLNKFELIPTDTDILITHSPYYGYGDKVNGKHCGSMALAAMMVFPKLHVCGHVHEGYGQYEFPWHMKLVNASLMNEEYDFINEPVRIEI